MHGVHITLNLLTWYWLYPTAIKSLIFIPDQGVACGGLLFRYTGPLFLINSHLDVLQFLHFYWDTKFHRPKDEIWQLVWFLFILSMTWQQYVALEPYHICIILGKSSLESFVQKINSPCRLPWRSVCLPFHTTCSEPHLFWHTTVFCASRRSIPL